MSKETEEDTSLDDFFDKQEPVKPRVHKSAGDENVCVSCEG